MSYPTDKTRLNELRGTGELGEYKPFINARDFNSIGTCEIVPDWITGRSVELLSQGEAMYWYILRFNPDIVDIKEQFPMNPNETVALADSLGIKHPKNRSHIMTIDFLITYRDGHQEAHSLKTSKKILEKDRNCELLFLEKSFWELHGIPYRLIFKNELNNIYARNIRFCSYNANINTVTDKMSCLKYMIINHLITIDTIETEELNLRKLLLQHESEVNTVWTTIASASAKATF